MNKSLSMHQCGCGCNNCRKDSNQQTPCGRCTRNSRNEDEYHACRVSRQEQPYLHQDTGQIPEGYTMVDHDTWKTMMSFRERNCRYPESVPSSSSESNSPLGTSNNVNYNGNVNFLSKVQNLMDYDPESTFLKRIKEKYLQQYQQGQNENSNCIPYVCKKCIDKSKHILRLGEHLNSGRFKFSPEESTNKEKSCGCPNIQEARINDLNEKKSPRSSDAEQIRNENKLYHIQVNEDRIAQTTDKVEKARKSKKSYHISRSKKPVKCRGRRKRKPDGTKECESQDHFEPTLKRPHENSCERCWKYASPSRSPVNKPDQRYNPNFRRAHSCTDFVANEREEGGSEVVGRHISPCRNLQPVIANEVSFPFLKKPHHQSSHLQAHSTEVKELLHDSNQSHSPERSLLREQTPRRSFQGVQQPEASFRRAQTPDKSFQKGRTPERTSQRVQQPEISVHKGQKSERSVQRDQETERSFQREQTERSFQRGQIPDRTFRSPSDEQILQRKGVSDANRRLEAPKSPGLIFDNTQRPRPQSFNPATLQARNFPDASWSLNSTQYPEIRMKSNEESVSHGLSARRVTISGQSDTNHSSSKTRLSLKGAALGHSNSSARSPRSPRRLDSSRHTQKSTTSTVYANLMSPSKTSTPKRPATSGGRSSKGNRSSLSKSRSPKSNRKSTRGRSLLADLSDILPPTRTQFSNAEDRHLQNHEPRPLSKNRGISLMNPDGFYNQPQPRRMTVPYSGESHSFRPCDCFPNGPTSKPGDNFVDMGRERPSLCCHCGRKEIMTNQTFNVDTRDPFSFLQNGAMYDRTFEQQNIDISDNQFTSNFNPNDFTQEPSFSVESFQFLSDPRGISQSLSQPTDEVMACPYRQFLNEEAPPLRRFNRLENLRRLSDENENYSPVEQHSFWGHRSSVPSYSPRKYCVFYMTKNKDEGNEVEVLVEELSEKVSNNNHSKTKDLTDKMKRVLECQSDSMALRFQKGVSESCKIPPSSRILYF